MEKYKDWDLLQVLPIGWKIDTSCGSPLNGYDFCTNGKSILNGGKRALVKSICKGTPAIEFIDKKHYEPVKKSEAKDDFIFPAKTVNILARKRFQAQLLKEIMVDLMICELENWDKEEYINELKRLINGISKFNKKENNTVLQPNLFSND